MTEDWDWNALRREAQSREWESLDELNEWLQKKTQAYNARPQRVLAGLSPEQAQRVFADDWTGSGPLRLNEELTLAELSGAPILNNARTFLRRLEEGGPVKATASLKNLPRKFIAEMIEAWQGDEYVLEVIAEFNRKNDEMDVYPVHTLRIVLGIAGLIKLRSGAFSITKRGKEMLKDEAAGRLYAELFRTHFRRFNLAYLDGYPDNPELQRTLAMTLYRLGRIRTAWMSPGELSEEVLIPTVLYVPDEENRTDLPGQMETRVLRPLVRFGLMEAQRVEGQYRFIPTMRYRRAPLFERFIRFQF